MEEKNEKKGKFERYQEAQAKKTPEQIEQEVGLKLRLDNEKLTKDDVKLVLGECFEGIKEVLKGYSDLREDYYDMVALWIIGTYLHKEFETFPYLFINAMRGSGKTRLLKLVSALACNGELVGSLKESVLFRDSKGKTLCVDECENIGSKESASLRELLNAGYKKGMKIKRMKKVRGITGEEWVAEEFEPYTPIALANIWGMEEVLGDRCISLILEKSNNERIIRVMEDFSNLDIVTNIKKSLNLILVYMCSYFSVCRYQNRWNLYINDRYTYTTTYTTYTTLTTLTTPIPKPENCPTTEQKLHELELFNKIHDTGINGRNLELMFPLFLIAEIIGTDVLDRMLLIATNLTKERRKEEMVESKDVSFLDFISRYNFTNGFYSIKDITNDFRNFSGGEVEEQKWINTQWVGRALRRLTLIIDKRRVGKGIEVTINLSKAKQKMEMFKK